MTTLPYTKGKSVNLKSKPGYVKATVEQSRLNSGSDQQWCGTRPSAPKGMTKGGKSMGKAY